MKSDYEEKKAKRIESYENLSEKNEKLSDDLCQESRDMVSNIPLGQPILIGHHSEQGHRNLINRSHNKMGKAVEAGKKAEYYERRAEAAAMNNNIYSDDPEALRKLRDKLASLEENREFMKTVNKEYKRNGSLEGIEILKDEKLKSTLRNNMIRFNERRPFPGYSISNLGQNIRTLKLRIEKMAKQENDVTSEKVMENLTLIDNVEENRLQLFFDDKPAEAIRTELKRNGFRWSPSQGCWQSYRSERANQKAQIIINLYEKRK